MLKFDMFTSWEWTILPPAIHPQPDPYSGQRYGSCLCQIELGECGGGGGVQSPANEMIVFLGHDSAL